MAWSSVLGIVSLVALLGFIVFAFRQGEKVRKGSDGTPTDHSAGYSPPDGSGGHGHGP